MWGRHKELRRLNMKIQAPMHEAMIELTKGLKRRERKAFAEFATQHREKNQSSRLPREVGGSSWGLEFNNGRIEFDVEELKKLSHLKILDALKGMDDIQVHSSHDFEDED